MVLSQYSSLLAPPPKGTMIFDRTQGPPFQEEICGTSTSRQKLIKRLAAVAGKQSGVDARSSHHVYDHKLRAVSLVGQELAYTCRWWR
jgi:hypothetical protein